MAPTSSGWSRGRGQILLDRFYNELSANPSRIDEQTRDHYAALYARPYAIHNAFGGQYAAFAQDAIDNQQLVAKGKLKMPVLAIGGDHSYGAHLATEIGFAAADVRAAVVEESGHWIMEDPVLAGRASPRHLDRRGRPRRPGASIAQARPLPTHTRKGPRSFLPACAMACSACAMACWACAMACSACARVCSPPVCLRAETRPRVSPPLATALRVTPALAGQRLHWPAWTTETGVEVRVNRPPRRPLPAFSTGARV